MTNRSKKYINLYGNFSFVLWPGLHHRKWCHTKSWSQSWSREARVTWSTWHVKHVTREARVTWSTCHVKHVSREARVTWSTYIYFYLEYCHLFIDALEVTWWICTGREWVKDAIRKSLRSQAIPGINPGYPTDGYNYSEAPLVFSGFLAGKVKTSWSQQLPELVLKFLAENHWKWLTLAINLIRSKFP